VISAEVSESLSGVRARLCASATRVGEVWRCRRGGQARPQKIVQRGAAKVVLTIRDDEPIGAATQELWKAGQFDRLDLQPLSRDDISTLISATLGGPLDRDARGRLLKLTRGNVLYICAISSSER
jgi:hypothetical protein